MHQLDVLIRQSAHPETRTHALTSKLNLPRWNAAIVTEKNICQKFNLRRKKKTKEEYEKKKAEGRL